MSIPLSATLANAPIMTSPFDSDLELSHTRTRDRFCSLQAANKYPLKLGRGFRAQRELRCLETCLADIAPGCEVLDLPCGSGRFLPLLLERGYRVTAADCSPHMIDKARRFVLSTTDVDVPIQFELRDIMRTEYRTDRFGAVLCHRLFHHFNEPGTRIAALRELHRISAGPVIVSFFNSFAIDAIKFRIKHFLRGTRPTDRIPIPLSQFREEVAESGFLIEQQHSVMWGLSPLWCLVLRHVPEESLPAGIAA